MTIDKFELIAVLALAIPTVILFGVLAKRSLVKLLRLEQMRLHKIKMALIRCVFQGSSDSVALKLVRKFNMEKTTLKHFIYGGIEEIIRDSNFYYYSKIGQQYSHFTEAGQAAVLEFMNNMAYKIRQAEEADLEKRAQEQTLNALKS